MELYGEGEKKAGLRCERTAGARQRWAGIDEGSGGRAKSEKCESNRVNLYGLGKNPKNACL